MRSSTDDSDALAAQLQRTALLNLHARALAHEISNLMFLAEICARQAPEAPAGTEMRKSLPLARRLARLLADALAPESKPRTLTVADAFEEIETLLLLPSKGQLPHCDLRLDGAGPARFQEHPGGLLLVVQDLLRQLTASERLQLVASVQGQDIAVAIGTPARTLRVTTFAATECAKNAFTLTASADGSVRLVLNSANADA